MYLIICKDRFGGLHQVMQGWPMFGEVTIDGQRMTVVDVKYFPNGRRND